MTANGAQAAEDRCFLDWLDRVILDERSDTPTGEADVRPLETVPAAFIRRAVIIQLEGKRAIRSGIEARRTRFTGDLHIENLEIGFPLFFIGCIFEGAIHAGGARTKTLSFTNSKIMLGADMRNVRVDGHVFFRGAFEAAGPLLLRDVKIEGTLDLSGGRFLYDGAREVGPFWRAARKECLGLSRAEATALLWNHAPPEDSPPHRPQVAGLAPQGKVTLRDVKVRSFRHDMAVHRLAAWPAQGGLELDGFSYDHIDDASRDDLLAWLALQERPSPGPYFMLASVLQKQGRKEDAVRIRAQVRRNEIEGYPWLKRKAAKAVFLAIDYGASSTRALWLMLFLFGVFFALVFALHLTHRMKPAVDGFLTEACYYGDEASCAKVVPKWRSVPIGGGRRAVRFVPPDYPDFSPLEYSLEAFVPVLDFGQHRYWVPAAMPVRLGLDLLALLGLFLGSLFVASLSGLLMPREN